MVRFQRKRTINVVLFILLFTVVGLILVEYLPSYDKRAMIINNLPDVDMIEMNLNAIREYSKPAGSVIVDFKNLFLGNYSSVVYTIHKYNLISTLFLIFMPLFVMFAALLVLGVSVSIITIVMAIFAVFTFLPLLLL